MSKISRIYSKYNNVQDFSNIQWALKTPRAILTWSLCHVIFFCLLNRIQYFHSIFACSQQTRLLEDEHVSHMINLGIIPWFHAFGCFSLIGLMINKATLVFLPKFEEVPFLQCIQVKRNFFLRITNNCDFFRNRYTEPTTCTSYRH